MNSFSFRLAASAIACFVSLLLFSPKAQAQTVVQQTTNQGRNEITTMVYLGQQVSAHDLNVLTAKLATGYPGKIMSCTGDTTTMIVTFVHKTAFPRMELLQLMTQAGYTGVYYLEDGYRVFLNPTGDTELREQQKN